jgi:cold shock CspA family protein
MTRLPGTIVRLVVDKGFGFLRDPTGVEYFFHRTACAVPLETLDVGDVVTFTASASPKGPRAEQVERVP